MFYKAIYDILQTLIIVMFSEDKKNLMLNLSHVQTKISSAFFWFINITMIVELTVKTEAFIRV